MSAGYARKRAANRVWFLAFDGVFMALFWGPIYGGYKAFEEYAPARQGAFIFAGVARATALRRRKFKGSGPAGSRLTKGETHP